MEKEHAKGPDGRGHEQGHGHDHNKTYSIIVNGRRREVTDHKLSYWEVVHLAFPDAQPAPNVVYTVTYSNPHGEDGTLVDGQDVVVKDGMIVNVRKTDQS